MSCGPWLVEVEREKPERDRIIQTGLWKSQLDVTLSQGGAALVQAANMLDSPVEIGVTSINNLGVGLVFLPSIFEIPLWSHTA